MIKQVRFFTIVLLSTFACVHAEQAMQSASTPKVVVVNLQHVAESSKWFKQIQAKAEAKLKPQVESFQNMEKTFNDKLQKLQNDAKGMKLEVQQKLQEELASLKAQLDIKQRGLQAAVESEMRAAEEQLIKEVQAVCKRLGYDVVIPGALYAKDDFDRTKQVISDMDKNVAAESTAKKLENEVESAAKRVKATF